MKKKHKKFTPGIALYGPLKGENSDRDFIEGYIFPHYQTYAEPASREFKGFYALYDPYGPAYLVREDNLDGLIEEIQILEKRYKDNKLIILELKKITSMIEKGKKIEGFIIMVTPYPALSNISLPIEGT